MPGVRIIVISGTLEGGFLMTVRLLEDRFGAGKADER